MASELRRPLRIGLVTPAWPGTRTANGIATAVTHLVAGLERCGHHVCVIAISIDGPQGATPVVAVPNRSRSIWERLWGRLNQGRRPDERMGERIAAAVNEAIRRDAIEIVVMEESFGWAGTVQQSVAIPVVATLHGPWFLHKRLHGIGGSESDRQRENNETAALQLVKGITSPSLDVLQNTRTECGLPDIPQEVIPNPMPLPDSTAERTLDPGSLERILFVGRFDYHKGGDILLAAFALLAEQHQDCRLTFAGPKVGVHYPDGRILDLSEAMAALPIETQNRIAFLGPQSREEVAELRKSHGITIVASRYENFGGTMTEAMAAGSALVCTNVGGCPELVSHEETGLLVPPENPEAIAAACLRLLRDPQLAERLGTSARQKIAADLDPDVIGRRMASFLAKVCRSG